MEANLRRWLSSLDPELAHRLGFTAAWLASKTAPAYLRGKFEFDEPILHQEVWGLKFSNPIGLAAGCDKNALLPSFWDQLGFGHIEIGSVTLNPSRGNLRPRLFRLEEDRAIINRLGLPSKGAQRVADRLSRISIDRMPIGVNIARMDTDTSVIEDYVRCATKMLPYASYLTINISCPNTKGGKILEKSDDLNPFLEELIKQVDNRVPILLKLSPLDSSKVIYDSQAESILETAVKHGVSGFVVSNTAKDRQELVTDSKLLDTIGPGGLSGPPIFQRAVQMIRYVRSCVGADYPIIGVGGITSAEDAYQMIRAGASLVQIYTALVYEGPMIVQTMKRDLAQLLKSDGHVSVASASGTAAEINALS
ncbi:MAG: quinone-dependent dihydroorotate dehydrogenase [Bacteroidetes bacterium]|nr:quinone-dependent dihydroorotate dehydrogenase [Bacteroidota bacterium]